MLTLNNTDKGRGGKKRGETWEGPTLEIKIEMRSQTGYAPGELRKPLGKNKKSMEKRGKKERGEKKWESVQRKKKLAKISRG